jgi:hypothetical protein
MSIEVFMITTENASKTVFWTLFVTFVIKILLAHFIPVTGDEAYYAIWGIFPQLGGYDHPPLIGWLLYPFLLLSKNPIVLRLPVILTTSIIGLGIYLFLKSIDKEKAAYASMLFLISPLALCGILITTDTPVILFSFLSGICVLQALKKNDHLGWFWLGGIFLGLAFFAKYFAVLLALSYFIYLTIIAPNRSRLCGLFILFLGVLPFGLENLWWNYTHGWANILFNIYNRNVEAHFSVCTIAAYLLTLLYIITPPLFYYLCKHFQSLFKNEALNIFITVPVIFFLVLSSVKEIGLHWPLSFITFIYLWAGCQLNVVELKRSIVFLIFFSGLHLILIAVILMLPIQTFQLFNISQKFYTKLVYFFEHKTINSILSQYQRDYIFSSQDYVQADMIFYDTNDYAPTFGKRDEHGREDDLITDFNDYNHKNFLIFYSRPPRPEEYVPYFSTARVNHFNLYGATFYYVLGRDFNYLNYRNNILKYINNTYWDIPSYIPHKPSIFCEKYFKQFGCN